MGHGCGKHQPTEQEKTEESQNKKWLWHCSAQVKTQCLPVKGQRLFPMRVFSLMSKSQTGSAMKLLSTSIAERICVYRKQLLRSGLWSSHKTRPMPETAVWETRRGRTGLAGQVWQVPSNQGGAAPALASAAESHDTCLTGASQKIKVRSDVSQTSQRTNYSLVQRPNHASAFQMTCRSLEFCFQKHLAVFSENLDLKWWNRRWDKSDS